MGRAKNSQSVERNVDDGAKSSFRTLEEKKKVKQVWCFCIAAESLQLKPPDTYLVRYGRRLHDRFKFLAVTFLGAQSAQLPDPR